MTKRKRWGKKHKDKRDWKTYNKQLIKRGEFYINPAFLETWNEEVKEMNERKVGQPYLYPHSLILFLAVLSGKGFDYRSLEGILGALSLRFGNFPVLCYSQIRKRIKKLSLEFKAKGNHLDVGVDGSGIKVSNRGEWVREKWKRKRGWIKVVIMGDVHGDIVDIRIGNEDLNENPAGRGMLRKNHKNIDTYMGDGLHDARANFALCSNLGIEPVIKIRENASTKSHGCLARKKEVLEYKKLGYKKWAKKKRYGMRWVATEGIYSAVKRMFGECVRSHKTRHMYHEAQLKFWAYQQVKDYGMR